MSAFGIRASEFRGEVEFYSSEDEVLYEWLVADNFEPSVKDGRYIVRAPEGYIFAEEGLIAEDSEEFKNLTDLSLTELITVGSPENDKGLLLIRYAMQELDSVDFYMLRISEARILDLEIY